MRRTFHPYWLWEDYLGGMWDSLPKDKELFWLKFAVIFIGDSELYGEWMFRVIEEWPFSCEHNLSNPSMNRLAWIGHAAVCLASGCPEYIVRRAWGRLTETQRSKANAKAESALNLWLKRQKQKENFPKPRTPRLSSSKSKIDYWVSKWESQGYPEGIPDFAPSNLEEMGKVPSYRMICLAIMRNDVALTTLGFGRPFSETYNLLKRVEIANR